jgi:hypothetical protein
VAWAIGGVHDRPWFERPIFGTIRYMSGASTGKKFDSARYIENVNEGRAFGDADVVKARAKAKNKTQKGVTSAQAGEQKNLF